MLPSKPLLSLLAVCGLVASQTDDGSAAVSIINQARQGKGLRPLTWDNNLASYADYWAKQMATGQAPFGHASGQYRPEQGENLFQRTSSPCDPSYDKPLQSAVNAWLAEGSAWGGQPISSGQESWLHWCKCSGHVCGDSADAWRIAQLMWKDTTHIGCARAFSLTEAYKIFDVCRFYPAGNM